MQGRVQPVSYCLIQEASLCALEKSRGAHRLGCRELLGELDTLSRKISWLMWGIDGHCCELLSTPGQLARQDEKLRGDLARQDQPAHQARAGDTDRYLREAGQDERIGPAGIERGRYADDRCRVTRKQEPIRV